MPNSIFQFKLSIKKQQLAFDETIPPFKKKRKKELDSCKCKYKMDGLLKAWTWYIEFYEQVVDWCVPSQGIASRRFSPHYITLTEC